MHMGNVVPFDGIVVEGNGAVNQSSITGESLPVLKENGGYVYAGTVLEEGELIVLGVGGLIQPTTSALIHNTSTLAISLNSMKDIL